MLTWTASEGEAAVLGLLHTALASPELIQEHVRVQLSTAQPLLGVVAAAGYGGVRLSLSVAACRASLTALDLQRTSGGGTLPTSLALALWSALEAGAVTRLRCRSGVGWVSPRAGAIGLEQPPTGLAVGGMGRRVAAPRLLTIRVHACPPSAHPCSDAGAVAALGDARVLGRFTALRVLNLSHAGLTALPPAVGKLSELQVRGGGVAGGRARRGRGCLGVALLFCAQGPTFRRLPSAPACPPPLVLCPTGAACGGQLAAHPAPGSGLPDQASGAGGRLQPAHHPAW